MIIYYATHTVIWYDMIGIDIVRGNIIPPAHLFLYHLFTPQ